jgi:glycerol-3-phosphate dehydrogenase
MGMELRDVLTGRQLSVEARVTINAAGARVPDVMALFGDARRVPMLKAMNLVTTVRASDMALAAPAASGRMLTLVPWRGRALVGTSQSGIVEPGTPPSVSEAEVQAFIAEANSAFPALHLTREGVALVHRGIVPAAVDGRGHAELLAHANLIDHSKSGARGALSILGLKYTTARGVAERTISVVGRQLGARVTPSRTAVVPLPGGAIADHEALAIETARAVHVDVPLPTLRHLSARYAERAAEMVRLIKERPDLVQPVAPGVETVGAEVVHAIRDEMAQHLTDVVIRRSSLGSAGHPGELAVSACGQLAARELGWDAARLDEEIAAVGRFYRVDS